MKEQKFHIGVKARIKNSQGKLLINKTPSVKYWDIPGGRIDEGEGIKEALAREFMEELGTEVEISDLYGAVLSKIRINLGGDTVGLCLLVYNCSLPEDSILNPGGKYDEYKWVEKKEALELLSGKYPEEFLGDL